MNRAILSTFLIPLNFRLQSLLGARPGHPGGCEPPGVLTRPITRLTGRPVASRFTRPAVRRVGLTLLAVFLGATAGACKQRAAEQPLTGPYYAVYDKAVALYFKQPRKPAEALALMKRACGTLKDHRALSCYNLGLLHELRGDATSAVRAYRLADEIKPHPVFRSAVLALEPDPAGRPGFYAGKMEAMIESCRNREPAGALGAMRQLVARQAKERSFRLHREIFRQPFLKRCLGHLKEYKDLLRKLPAGRRDLYKRYYKVRAKLHPFHSLWDMELYLRGLRADARGERPRHAVTLAWRRLLEATAKGNIAGATLALEDFFKSLEKQRKSARTRKSKRRIRAMGRGAALLVQRDSHFARIRSPEIDKLIAPWVRR